MSYYDWYPESRPIRTDRDSRPAAGAAASPRLVGERWIRSLEQLWIRAARRGRRYARRGRSSRWRNCRRRGGRSSRLAQETLPGKDKPRTPEHAGWERVIDALAERAVFAARLSPARCPKRSKRCSPRPARVSSPPPGATPEPCSCPDPARETHRRRPVHARRTLRRGPVPDVPAARPRGGRGAAGPPRTAGAVPGEPTPRTGRAVPGGLDRLKSVTGAETRCGSP